MVHKAVVDVMEEEDGFLVSINLFFFSIIFY